MSNEIEDVIDDYNDWDNMYPKKNEKEEPGIIVNNKRTNEDDNVFYVDKDRNIHEAVIKSIVEKDGNHHADLEVDGKTIKDVPHNTSIEAHSWNHPRPLEEIALHNKPDFYG